VLCYIGNLNKNSKQQGLLGTLGLFKTAKSASVLKLSQCYAPSPDFENRRF